MQLCCDIVHVVLFQFNVHVNAQAKTELEEMQPELDVRHPPVPDQYQEMHVEPAGDEQHPPIPGQR